MTRLPRPTAGTALTIIGILHTGIGLAEHRAVLREIVRDGVIDAVEGDPEREAAFWFITCGVSLVLMGRLARWTRLQAGALPPFVGPALLGIGTAGSPSCHAPGSGPSSLRPSWPSTRETEREVCKWEKFTTA